MRTVLIIRLAVRISLVWVIATAFPVELSAQTNRHPEVAAAERFKSLPRPIALDPRTEGWEPHGIFRADSLTARIAVVIGARVAELESMRQCEVAEPVSSPFKVCRLVGAESYLAVSEPVISASGTAYVRVKVVRNNTDAKRSTMAAEWEVTLRLVGSAWTVQAVRILAVT